MASAGAVAAVIAVPVAAVMAVDVAAIIAVWVGAGSAAIAVAVAAVTAVAVAAVIAVAGTGVAVGIGVADGTVVGVDVGAGGTPHAAAEIEFVSSVTAPFRASVRPETKAPVVTVMLVSARIFPLKVVPVPRVAELPTWKNALHRLPLLMNRTEELLAVVNVLPILKTKTEAGFPRSLSDI